MSRRRQARVTIEPAHEALLRQWGLLQGWLKEDLAALATWKACSVELETGPRTPRARLGSRTRPTDCMRRSGSQTGRTSQEIWSPPTRAISTACRNAARVAAARSRRVQAIAAALLVLLALCGLGWLYQDTLRERGYWLAFMRPQVLTKAQERALKPGRDIRRVCE